MKPFTAALKSAPIADQITSMQAVRQKLLADGLISAGSGGGLSFKTTSTDLCGDTVEALLMQDAADRAPVLSQLAVLRHIAQCEELPETERRHALSASRLSAECATPDEMALLHACLPAPAVILVTHPAILAVGCLPDWQARAKKLFGDETAALEFAPPGPALYEGLVKAAQAPSIFVRYYGLLLWSETLEEACRSALGLVEKARGDFNFSQPLRLASVPAAPPLRVDIAQYRQEISKAWGAPQLVRLAGRLPTDMSPDLLKAPGAPSALHGDQRQNPPENVPHLGLVVHAAHADELDRQTERLMTTLHIYAAAQRGGALEMLAAQADAGTSTAKTRGLFSGEVALVTGAATGIGRAAVQSLLERGAAVIGLDIKPQITTIFDCPAYLGLEVDLTDEAATLDCLEKAVRAFGGLDMLVLNAGIFPASCNLDALSVEHWRKVMQINVDVNTILLREAYPLLKRAPRYGRVVINSSRNVPAPGPGAAAYSASKAALTQLGRVAALEWASAGIRVNMVNPHAVFDTDLWTDEVIRSRAAKYGLTVEQYKTNNLLRVEITSRDLGELIAEALGPLFAKTTGAQIPVDGGSDRVI